VQQKRLHLILRDDVKVFFQVAKRPMFLSYTAPLSSASIYGISSILKLK